MELEGLKGKNVFVYLLNNDKFFAVFKNIFNGYFILNELYNFEGKILYIYDFVTVNNF